MVCLHNNAIVARCILDTNIALWATRTAPVPSMLLVLLEPHLSWPQTYDGYSALHTPCIWLGIPECRMWILPHFKISHSNTWSWCWSFKCRVLRNCHKFRAWTQNSWWILRTLHSGFTLHTQDSPIQIQWVLSVECWVFVISLGPGLPDKCFFNPCKYFHNATVFQPAVKVS